MKTIVYTKYIIAVLLISLLYSCESYTEIDTPQSQLTTPAVFEDMATANAAMADIYARIRETGMTTGASYGVTGLLSTYSDEMQYYGTGLEFEQFSNHTVIPSNFLLKTWWDGTYGSVYAANLMLEGLEKSVALSGEDRDRLSGEALFIRAYLHFYLVNVFGDVPYITTTDYRTNTVIPKTPQEQVWQNIIADLTKAESLLPPEYPTQERVRANKAVASAFLARVYLYRQDWENAAIKATAVIENPDYVWSNDLSVEFLKGSKAIIWSFHPGFPGINSKDAGTFYISAGPPTRPSLLPGFVNAFEAGDQRRVQWVRTITSAAGTWYCSYKYKKRSATPPTSEEYTILFRLAEQYLIRAEAYANMDNIEDARSDVDKIRTRAGLLPTTAATKENVLEAIADERRFELFTEQGHRWFDLKRTGKAAEILAPLKPGWKDTDLLLPLPQTELSLNPNLLPQNPGY